MASQLVEKREELAAKRAQFLDILGKYETEPMPEDVLADLKTRKSEMDALHSQVVDLQALHAAAEDARKSSSATPPMPGEHSDSKGGYTPRQRKSIEQILNESKDYAQWVARDMPGRLSLDMPLMEQKATVTLSTINVQADLMPGYVPYAYETRTVGDLMLQGSTSGNSIQYYEQTTRTNAAAPVAEEGTKQEATVAFTLRTDPVEVIAVWIPATRQALSDIPFLQSSLEGELTSMIKQEEEEQLLTGDGTSPNISGILDRSGIQTQAKGADATPTAIYKAITKVRNTGFAEPTAIVMHPNDWEAVATLQTADGIYIWGNPALPVNETIWGLPVRVTTAMTENTALVGAFRPYAKRVRREDVTVTLSTEHSDFFIKNKVAILAEERLALQVTRPAAFCTVTGI